MMKKVLIVDDDPRNIFALSATLKSRGYVCVSAADGNEALRLLADMRDIRLILTDIMMPETDGYELIGKIRKDQGFDNITIIAVTAQAMPGDKEKCLEAGADYYVSKPIDVDKLLDLMGSHLN